MNLSVGGLCRFVKEFLCPFHQAKFKLEIINLYTPSLSESNPQTD